jgi:hypothetical protein
MPALDIPGVCAGTLANDGYLKITPISPETESLR